MQKKILAAAACAAMALALALALAPAADAAGRQAARTGELKIAPKALKAEKKPGAGKERKEPRPKGPGLVIYEPGDYSRGHSASAKRMQAEQERALRILERNIERRKEIERRAADRQARADARAAERQARAAARKGGKPAARAAAVPAHGIVSAHPIDARMEDPDVLAAQSILDEARAQRKAAEKPAKRHAGRGADRRGTHADAGRRAGTAGAAVSSSDLRALPDLPAEPAARQGKAAEGRESKAGKQSGTAQAEVKRLKNRIEPGDVQAVSRSDAGRTAVQAPASAPASAAAKPAPAPAPAPAASQAGGKAPAKTTDAAPSAPQQAAKPADAGKAAEAKPAAPAKPDASAKPAAPAKETPKAAPAPEKPVLEAGGSVQKPGEGPADGLPLPRRQEKPGEGDLGGPAPEAPAAPAPHAKPAEQDRRSLEETFQRELEKTLRDAGASLRNTLRHAGESFEGVLLTGRTFKIPGGERRARLLLREWKGGRPMPKRELRETLRAVTKVLTPDGRWCTDAVAALLMETAAVETDLGEIVRQKGGPALSPWQLLNMNYRELPQWFAKRDPELYRRAMTLYDHSKPAEWNKVHNVPWTAAMCLLHYEQATKGRFTSCLGSLDERAGLWKRSYNTYLGAGTVAGYKKKARRHVYGGSS